MAIEILRRLHGIISASLDTLESIFAEAQLNFPSLDNAFDSDSPVESLANLPDVIEATNFLVSAAEQLIATVKRPYLSLFDSVMAYHIPACLAFVERVHIVEILKEAGSDGMHIDCLAARAGVHSIKLEHVLRLLATHYFFREVTPNVFTNNRLSSLIDSGKTSTEILANPKIKFPGSSGAAAFIGFAGDEQFKAAAFLPDTYLDPKTSHSALPGDSAFSRAFQTNNSFFDWLEESQNENRLARFGHAIMGISLSQHPEAIENAYDWAALPKNSLVVDVGGGLGFASLRLSKRFHQLQFVIQDLPGTIDAAEKVWKSEYFEAWNSKRVELKAHDFMEAQSEQNVSVFLVRAVCHDWPDADALIILSRLRQAARRDTILIIGDYIMPYACPDDSLAAALPGAEKMLAPPPLLANLGKATATAFYMDLTMQSMLNSHERTLQEIVELSDRAGWQVVSVSTNGVSRFGYLIASAT